MIYDPEYLDNDFAKARQVEELGAEMMLRPAPQRPHYFKERNTKEDFYSEIVAENVRASSEQINYHE